MRGGGLRTTGRATAPCPRVRRSPGSTAAMSGGATGQAIRPGGGPESVTPSKQCGPGRLVVAGPGDQVVRVRHRPNASAMLTASTSLVPAHGACITICSERDRDWPDTGTQSVVPQLSMNTPRS
jgi:hypothetical protein